MRALAALLLASAAPVSPPPQVEMGERLYAFKCAACHADALGGGLGPALAGPGFATNWNGKPLRALYGRIISTMPQGEAGTLTERQALAITLFLAARNGHPVNDAPIATAADFDTVSASFAEGNR